MRTIMLLCAVFDTVCAIKSFGMGNYGWAIYDGCLTVFALFIASNYKENNDETDSSQDY
jgi:hypothetical protein